MVKKIQYNMTKENKEKELKEEVQQTPAAESEIEADVQEIQEENEEKQPEPDEIGLLNSKVEELEAKLAREKDDYIRLMAEFDNFRRRTSQEKLDLVSVASMDTIKGLLPILDDCERALAVLGESSDSEAAKEGTNLIYTKLLNYLQSKGLAVIEAAGQVF